LKIRTDFVTNSSSSSYIICFARIADEEKAKKIIEKHKLDVLSSSDVKHEMRWGELGADWAGATLYGTDKILQAHPNDKYIIIEDSNEADYDEDYEPIYNYNFDMNDAIDEITEENGFTDIDCAEGEGRDG
jgi:hypothetical protein